MNRTSLSVLITLTTALSCLSSTNTQTGIQTFQLEEIVVLAERIRPLNAPFNQDKLLSDTTRLNAAQAALSVPGVARSCRAIDAPEISIRGMGWERVPTQLDFLPLYGSCPARMDPPATYLSPESIANMTIVKGLPSVTYGSGGTGGRIMIKTITDPADSALDGFMADAITTWNEGRSGWNSRVGTTAGNGKTEIGISANAIHLNDYESGSGKTVPGENRSHGAAVKIKATPNENSGYFGSWNMHRVDHLDYPALPMDATDVLSHTITFGSRHKHVSNNLENIEWQAGYAISEHDMDNSRKPNQPRMDNSAVTESETVGLRIASGWRFNDSSTWNMGTDAHQLSRNGTRTRVVKIGPPPPGTYYDPIWPDATQQQVGLFTEHATELENDNRLRIGLRIDSIYSTIDRGDEATPFDPTVLDGFERLYGADTRDTDRNELLVSGNILWEVSTGENSDCFFGAGVSQRAASITERFYAYAPAPGGFQVGNPSLDPETKTELDGGLNYYNDSFEIGVHGYISHVHDFILETRIGTTGTGAPIRGFINSEVLLGGGEIDGRWHLNDQWSIPFDVAYIRGINIEDGRDIPLISPLSGRLALRLDTEQNLMPWAEFVFRAATAQQDIDPLFGESETPGYQVFDLRAGCQITKGISMEVGAENLLDQDYTDHLSRETLFVAGDLAAGEKIPMPGRFFYASVKWSM